MEREIGSRKRAERAKYHSASSRSQALYPENFFAILVSRWSFGMYRKVVHCSTGKNKDSVPSIDSFEVVEINRCQTNHFH